MNIIRTRVFGKALKKLGASEWQLQELEEGIAANPMAGDVIQGLKGVRKIRFGLGNKCKSGDGRAIYVLVVRATAVYLLFACSKNEQEDLSAGQRKVLVAIVKELSDG